MGERIEEGLLIYEVAACSKVNRLYFLPHGTSITKLPVSGDMCRYVAKNLFFKVDNPGPSKYGHFYTGRRYHRVAECILKEI